MLALDRMYKISSNTSIWSWLEGLVHAGEPMTGSSEYHSDAFLVGNVVHANHLQLLVCIARESACIPFNFSSERAAAFAAKWPILASLISLEPQRVDFTATLAADLVDVLVCLQTEARLWATAVAAMASIGSIVLM